MTCTWKYTRFKNLLSGNEGKAEPTISNTAPVQYQTVMKKHLFGTSPLVFISIHSTLYGFLLEYIKI